MTNSHLPRRSLPSSEYQLLRKSAGYQDRRSSCPTHCVYSNADSARTQNSLGALTCVTTKLGSMSPFLMRSSKGRKYRCTCVCPVLIVSDLFMTAPIGILSTNPPYTPGIETVPPFWTGRDRFAQGDKPIRFHHHGLLEPILVIHGTVCMGFKAHSVHAGVRTSSACVPH